MPITDNINVSSLNVSGGSSRWAFNLRGYSAVNTPCGTTNACAVGPGSRQIIDPIRRNSIADSTFVAARATTGTFPFGDQVQAVQALTLTNVVRNGVRLPDGTYAAP